MSPPTMPTLAAVERFILRRFLHSEEDGILVSVTSRRKPTAALQKVVDAVHLVREVAPRSYATLQSAVRQLVVGSSTVPGYSRWTGTGRLAARIVERDTAPEVAATIVFEATWARLARRGIVPLTAAARKRSYVCCVRAQIAFVDSLPRDQFSNTDRYIEWLKRHITSTALDAA
jgi:hypothetical protein